jgi:hypothetical protein
LPTGETDVDALDEAVESPPCTAFIVHHPVPR